MGLEEQIIGWAHGRHYLRWGEGGGEGNILLLSLSK